ncbi:MAG: flagellar brake protein [Clostridia bacterium]|nr:flagellar brake protein [Clostridia bacterium]
MYDKPKIGEKIEILPLTTLNKKQNSYFSRVEDVDEQQNYVITQPILSRKPLHLKIDQKLKLIYYSQRGQLYFFCRVIEIINKKGLVLYKLKSDSPVGRIQRRKFFRLDVNLKVEVFSEDKQFIKSAVAKDISGGGIRVVSNQKFDQDSIVFCDIKTEHLNGELIKGKVIRSNKIDDHYYETAFKFIDIDTTKRESIIKFIFEMQRKLLEKGF